MSIKYCSNCGAKLESSVKFCHECGVEIVLPKESITNSINKKPKPKTKEKFDTNTLEAINKKIEVENNQQTTVSRLWIATAIFGILTILPFMEWSPITGYRDIGVR